MSEVSMVRRRLASPVLPDPAPAAPLENEDLLYEILLRLPPRPSSLLRISVVCKRWRRLVSDPGFLRRFRAHHRKPPLLGFFSRDGYAGGYCFTPTLDPPDRIPAGRFSLPQRPGEESLTFVGCRHGLALLLDSKRPEAVVWNPISDQQRRVAVPPEFDHTVKGAVIYAAVVCAAGDDGHGHVHGDCDLSYFKLVLVRSGNEYTSALACLYKSKSAVWGNVISTTTTDGLSSWRNQGVLVGNAFCCLLGGDPEGDILRFDFDMQKLAVIEKPVYRLTDNCSSQIIRTEESALGLIVLTQELSMQLCERKVNSDDVGRWVLQKSVDLVDHLSPSHHNNDMWPLIRGYDEDHNVLFLRTSVGLFMIQIDSMESKEISGEHFITCRFPYTSFYASDWATGGRDGPGMSSST